MLQAACQFGMLASITQASRGGGPSVLHSMLYSHEACMQCTVVMLGTVSKPGAYFGNSIHNTKFEG